MHACTADAVAQGEMVGTLLIGRIGGLDHAQWFLSGGAWKALVRSQEGVLAHRRPPQPSDPTRVPTKRRHGMRMPPDQPDPDRSTAAFPQIKRAPPEFKKILRLLLFY